MNTRTQDLLTLGEHTITPGERRTIELPVTDLYTHTSLKMPVQVVRGKKPGPTLFLSAAIHGDEINGVEIVRRVLDYKGLDTIRGTLIAVPIVNVQGFLAQSRYTPDRRDLNRCFPGNSHGSVASRLANLFVQEIVLKSDCGIDLHTAAIHRDNLPQIRAQLQNPETARLAQAFDAPVVLNTNLRDGSLRHYADEQGIPILLYEAGEALRFEESSIRIGARGVLNVMRELGMLRPSRKKSQSKSVTANSSHWIRAQRSGILRATVGLGCSVSKGQTLGTISDPFGIQEQSMKAEHPGILIGRTNLPLVNEGDAVFHIARFEASDDPLESLETLHTESTEWGLPVSSPII